MRLTKAESDKRRKFVLELAKSNEKITTKEIIRSYQKKFGTYLRAERIEEWLRTNGHFVKSDVPEEQVYPKLRRLIGTLKDRNTRIKELERQLKSKADEAEKFKAANHKLRQDIIRLQLERKQWRNVGAAIDQALKQESKQPVSVKG